MREHECAVCETWSVENEAYWSKEETASRLASARTFLKITQAELAERLGVSEATVRRHEQGRNLPEDPHGRAFLLEQLASLGVPRSLLGLPPETYSLYAANPDEVAEMMNAAEAVAEIERERRARTDGEPD